MIYKGLFLIFIILCTSLFLVQNHSIQFIVWIKQLGWLAPVFFLLFYSLASLFFLPTMIFTLAGGAIFGPLYGTILNLIGATLGACFSFLISRYFIYNWFTKKRGKKINKFITEVNQKGWVFVAFLRLTPIVPFNIVNYGLGITDIRFSSYILTTFIFLIPAEIIYTYFGYASMEVLSRSEHFYKAGSLILLGLSFLFLAVIHLLKRNNKLKMF